MLRRCNVCLFKYDKTVTRGNQKNDGRLSANNAFVISVSGFNKKVVFLTKSNEKAKTQFSSNSSN